MVSQNVTKEKIEDLDYNKLFSCSINGLVYSCHRFLRLRQLENPTHPFQDQLAEKDNNRCGLIALRFLTFGRIFKVLGEFFSMGFILGRFCPARYKANIFLPNQNLVTLLSNLSLLCRLLCDSFEEIQEVFCFGFIFGRFSRNFYLKD